ncbi:MAG: hypothetical protein R3246_14700, partial [Acidimicrobiia bacterium]|nr:hypothetical protein [Acidimicrobiia bacterium]
WSGWSGLIATAAFLVTVIQNNVGGVAEPEGPGEILGYLDQVSRSPSSFYVYGFGGIVLVLLYIPMAAGIYRLLDRSTEAWFGSVAVITGLAVLLPAYLITVLVPAGLAPAAADLGGPGTEALYAIHTFATATAESLFTVGSVLSLGIGPLLWGFGWLRSLEHRRWLGWLGIVTGVSGMVWFVWLTAGPLVLIALIVNVLCSLVLFGGISIDLVSLGRTTR